MERRLTPFNEHVAARNLAGQVVSAAFVDGWPMQIKVAVSDLRTTLDSVRRDRQLLYGEHVQVFDIRDGLAFCQAKKDGYVGYVAAADLSEPVDPTHFVSSRATHLYPKPDLKQKEAKLISFGSRLRVVAGQGNFFETDDGLFVPRPHVRPVKVPLQDPATIAQLFFGAPYLWGGNSQSGIDCSGLVQITLHACGYLCPADSDLQEKAVWKAIDDDVTLQRGDLIFWKGHVAMAVDGETIIHANGHHMAVVYEPVAEALERICEQGGGPVTSRKRI